MFSDEEIKLLGLDRMENKVLGVLQRGSFHVSRLAEGTKIGRTSLYPILGRLKQRGLVSYSYSGKRKHWHMISIPKLQEALFSLAENHRVNQKVGEKEVGVIASQESAYKIYRGRKKLIQIYDDLSRLPRSTRVYGIQPNASVGSALKNLLSRELVGINERIKERQIIVDAVLQEDFVDYYASALKKLGKSPETILKSYGERAAVTTYVPKEYLNFNSEIIFYENILAILNWKQLTAIVIKDSQMTGIMGELFRLIKLTGRRVDQNPKVRELASRSKRN
jgi:hypothetical protein